MASGETASKSKRYEQASLAEDLGEDVLALAAVAESDRPASVIRRINGRLVRVIVEAR